MPQGKRTKIAYFGPLPRQGTFGWLWLRGQAGIVEGP
ncbi:uncharacterized protein METZ01_LOCUS203708, partial [marine metagenome]